MSKTRGVFGQRIANLTLSALLVATSIFTAVPFLLSSEAAAAGTVVVRPNAMNGWIGFSENTAGGSSSFVTGPTGAPLGTGSAELRLTAANQGYVLGRADLAGTKLADITTLSYSSYVQQGNSTVAPALFFNVVRDASVQSWQGRLTYEPYRTETVVDGAWQNFNALSGKWFFSAPSNFDNQCSQNAPCTTAEILSRFPNIAVSVTQGFIGFKAGSGWPAFVGNVDNVRINDTTYDFEPVYVDTERPSISFVNPSTVGQALRGSAAVTLSLSDNVQLASVAVNLKDAQNSGNVGPCGSANNLNTTTFTFTCTLNTALYEDGTYVIRAGTTDAAGNNRTISRSIIIDNTNPVVAITSPTPNAIVPGSFTIEGTVSDAASGVSGVSIVVNKWVNGAFQGRVVDFEPATVVGNTFSYQVSGLEELENGYYALRAIATDAAGNTKTTGHDVRVDTKKPVTTLLAPEVASINPTEIRVVSTDTMGLSRVTANIYNEANTQLIVSCSDRVAPTETSYELVCPISGLADGVYTIRANAQDTLIRTSNTVIRQFTIDRTAPTVAVTSPVLAERGTTATFQGTVAGDFASLILTLNGVDYVVSDIQSDGSWNVTVDTTGFVPQSYTATVVAVDAAGNRSTEEQIAFTVTEPAVLGEDTENDPDNGSTDVPGTDVNEPRQIARNTQTPTIVGPAAANGDVLGNTSDDEIAQNGSTDVEGIDTVGQAVDVDSEENQGTFAGLAWYWWLLILAGIAAIVAGIVRALRGRSA